MTTAGAEEVSQILERVKDWSPPSKMMLARRILESLAPAVEGGVEAGSPGATTTRGVPVESIIGLFRTDREPPDDEECLRIIEEERWKKYGS